MRWKLFIVGVLLGSLAFQSLTTSADQASGMSVPFLTQFDGSAYAGTNCGPASVAMAINYATGKSLKPIDVRQAIIKLPGGGYAASTESGTAVGDLARVARANGVEVFMGDGPGSTGWGPERIRKHLGEGHTVIVLVRLAYMPGYSGSSQFDHYVLLIGATASGYVYNDPGLSAGARRTIGEQQLRLAQRNTSVPTQGAAFAGPSGARAAVAESSGQSVVAAQPAFTITVAPGDTLSQLAERYGVAQKDIVALNRAVIANVNLIKAGQVLALPESARPSSDAATSQPELGKPSTEAASSQAESGRQSADSGPTQPTSGRPNAETAPAPSSSGAAASAEVAAASPSSAPASERTAA
ncbi:MAG: LysM peptidoglycan-binding domain-containing protein, partial [Chloroflexota bacterium]|nr:LysM peptidoglycan-binding domain-containing protein [Chloroflexota bacterium]